MVQEGPVMQGGHCFSQWLPPKPSGQSQPRNGLHSPRLLHSTSQFSPEKHGVHCRQLGPVNVDGQTQPPAVTLHVPWPQLAGKLHDLPVKH